MHRNSVCLAALSAVAALGLASGARAAEQFNQDLAAPGVYFGTGNGVLPEEFTTNTADGVELGLRSKISGIHPQIVPTEDTYFIPLGATFNFDYSFNPDISGSEISLAGVTALITITDQMTGGVATFDPSPATITDDCTSAVTAHCTGGPAGGYQNSEKISFGFLFPTYNANVNDTFHITYTVSGLTSGPLSVDNIVQVGSGAPEPASWALMIVGFVGIGAGLRRSRKTAAPATA